MAQRRIKTVEYDHRLGWIARSPYTGEEIQKDFRWTSRSVARAVVAEHKLMRRLKRRKVTP